jgi:dTDP-4-dehydrorhamnose 3,5-epimerase
MLLAVDIRRGSPTLGQFFALQASAENKLQLWAPAHFARGFCVLSEVAEIQYKCTSLYNPKGEGGIRWNDPRIGIPWGEWGIEEATLSPKDAQAPLLEDWLQTPAADFFAL